MTNKFPLFRLPYVALNEVLNHVRPVAILSLSLCSKRSKHLVKICQGPQKDINIELDVTENVLQVNCNTFISVTAVSTLPTNLKTVKIGSRVVPIKMKKRILKTYWLDKKDGLREITKYTLDVFDRDLFSIEFPGRGHSLMSSNDVREWLEWIKTRQGKIREFFLSYHKVDNDLLMYILESDIVTGVLHLSTTGSSEFRGPPPRPYSIDHLLLEEANWVTLDHLLAMDIKQINLEQCSLTCQEINVFLKKWINGECSKRINQLYVAIEDEVNNDVLLEGIEVNRRDPSLRRDYVSYDRFEDIDGGLDVRRKEDGAMATIIDDPVQLKILFWPDHKGIPYH